MVGENISNEEGNKVQQLDISDRRAKVKDPNVYPYNCVGLILSYFKNNSEPTTGTGFLVSKREVLTAFHNVYDRGREKFPRAEEVYFIPNAHGSPILTQSPDDHIPANEFSHSPEYLKA